VTEPYVAVVLPPRETFSPRATGAIGLLARRLALAPADIPSVVFGIPGATPFTDVPFRPVRPAWRLGGNAARYAAGVARLLAAEPPTLIEVHNRIEVALALARRFPARPVMLVLHNDPQGMRRARTPAERAALLQRVEVATVSGYLRERFLQGVGGAPLVPVLPNCVDLAEIPASPAQRENRILFAGRVVADKGTDAFVRACGLALRQLPGWSAEVLGADRFGPRSPETPFLRALRPEAVAGGVVLAGWRPHPQILASMARAAIVVVPSRWPEPFGMTALEAMACGAALLCATRGGLPEVVGDAAVPIDPDDVPALAASIVALARDPARRAALGEAGRARAKKFDVAAAAATRAALRRDVLAAWPRRVGQPI
jgi:glycosyltransferase involved in cell wall biosynthesis